MEMDVLIARLEAATEGSTELSATIGRDVMGHVPHDPVVPYTTSLDAALTLVPDSAEWSVERRLSKGMLPAYASIWAIGARDIDFHANGSGKTPAIALCIAALRARESA